MGTVCLVSYSSTYEDNSDSSGDQRGVLDVTPGIILHGELHRNKNVTHQEITSEFMKILAILMRWAIITNTP